MNCADCHMPAVPSFDDGNVNGLVHSHRFPGANTAVPTANQDQAQYEFAKKFLQDKQLTVDIFAISPAGKETNAPARNEFGKPELSTTFAVGEESDASLPKGPAGEVRPITAPIDRTDAAGRRGYSTLPSSHFRKCGRQNYAPRQAQLSQVQLVQYAFLLCGRRSGKSRTRQTKCCVECKRNGRHDYAGLRRPQMGVQRRHLECLR